MRGMVMLWGSMVVASGVPVGELGALHATSLPSAFARPVVQAAQQDPASALYREAREALSRDDLTVAAARFERIRSEHPSSMYVPDSYYWQAFALYREG
ncbi:MAG TPA: outer membrane protein assembly factor BamD, partial [Longimicrobiales bacterium]|nr:outer membrane protein assembly factor BamD [Longimicrobiales bacterium]